jgi:acetyltransferase (GNAT) family protein
VGAGRGGVILGMKITFTFEPVAYLLSCGLHALGRLHWEEGIFDKSTFPYEPNWEEYEALERQNAFRIIAVRADGKLIGYAGVKVFHDIQSQNVLCAYIQEYFVLPEFRNGTMAGIGMFRHIETQLTALKVKVIFLGDKEFVRGDRGGLGKLFDYLGYESREKIRRKILVAA